MLVQSLKQIAKFDTENEGHLPDGAEFGVDTATFEEADVCPVKSTFVRETFLREPLRRPDLPYFATEFPLEHVGRHSVMVVDMLNERLQHR